VDQSDALIEDCSSINHVVPGSYGRWR